MSIWRDLLNNKIFTLIMISFLRIANNNFFTIAFIFSSVLLNLGLWQGAAAEPAYQIDGYYLGASPDDIGVALDIDPDFQENYYDLEINRVQLFFIKVESTMHLYRIIKEQELKSQSTGSVLSSLKKKYGTPDKQEIKTSSVRPKYKRLYVTTTKNKAIWNISETQEFIAVIEKNRVVYELLEHNPEHIKPRGGAEGLEDGLPGNDGWDPDY